jgi:integrase
MRGLSPDTAIVKPNLIRLVRRADSTYRQAHYKLDKWMRKGTGTADLGTVKEFAQEEGLKAKILIKENTSVVSRKFRAVADLVLRHLEVKIAADKTKRGSANDYKAAISIYLVPFFGGYTVTTSTASRKRSTAASVTGEQRRWAKR